MRPAIHLLALSVLLCGCVFEPGASATADNGDLPPSQCDVAPAPGCDDAPAPEPAPDAGSLMPSSAATPPLLAHWPFDGTSRDDIDTFDAEEISSVNYVAGRHGLAVDLSSESGGAQNGAHVRVASDAPDGITPGTLSPDSLTVALWMKSEDTRPDAVVFERGRPCLGSYWLQLTGTTLSAAVNAGTTWCDTSAMIHTTIDTSTWQHVTFTAERSPDYAQLRLRLYLNGSLVAYQDFTGFFPNGAVGQDDHARYLVMGRNYLELDGSGDAALRHYRGLLDDVRVYGGALTAEQVATLYASY